MSVQVSYKKQGLFALIALLLIFISVEIIANVWWITQINCDFEDSEVFSEINNEQKRQLCIDLYEVKTSGSTIIPNQSSDSITINSLGFRGDEFLVDPVDDTFRIFMVGGSTMFGHGATSDATTIPGYTNEFFLNNYEEYNVEVINAGIQGSDSFDELNLIETKLKNYNPNLIIVYDGWNDLREQNSPISLYENWNLMCELGKENNFDVVIILQPIAGFGNKPLTQSEIQLSKTGIDYSSQYLLNSLKTYDQYATNLESLDNCSLNLDFRGVFDNEDSPIYWDQGHISDNGNSIVSEEIYSHLLEFLPTNIPKKLNDSETKFQTESTFDNQLHSIFSNYKTPMMVNSIISIETPPQNIISESQIQIFQSQKKNYNDTEISISLKLISNPESKIKNIEIHTFDHTSDKNISHVTYFIKISDDQKILFSDFFYVADETLFLEFSYEIMGETQILGERQYDHNAIIAKGEPVKILGPLFDDDKVYNFDMELRTVHDPENWVFSLDGFKIKLDS